jgi:hypothetical protein
LIILIGPAGGQKGLSGDTVISFALTPDKQLTSHDMDILLSVIRSITLHRKDTEDCLPAHA